MNASLTEFQRRLAAAIAVACTLATAASPVLAQEPEHPRMHSFAHEERMHEDRGMPEHGFDMQREGALPGRGFDTQHEGALPGRDFDTQRERALPERGFDTQRNPLPQSPAQRYAPARFAPPHGTVVTHLPPQTIVVQHGGVSYNVYNGVWYRPYGPRFTVVAAPIGAFVPVLPSFYTTVWFGGLPYYFADDVYYSWRPEQSAYEIVQPPPGAPQPVVNGDRIYAYPLEDQSPTQQARDRYDCHVWASNEIGLDSSQTTSSMTTTQSADYDRALTACLTGRGYSVK